MDENMSNEKQEKIILLLKYYFKEMAIVHLTKKDGIFYNGRIMEIGSDFIILHDRKDGNQVVFFSEINSVYEYEVEE